MASDMSTRALLSASNTSQARGGRGRRLAHRLVVLLVTSALAFTGLLIGAQTAHATSTPAALTMNSNCNAWTQSGTNAITVTGDLGDTFTVMSNVGCLFANFINTGASGIVTPSVTNIIAFVGPQTLTIVGWGTYTYSDGTSTLSITVSAAPTSLGTGVAASTPPDIHQGVTMSGAGACGSLNRTDLDWAGVETGNWSQSWAWWPNRGTGGPVCQRVLWYDAAASRWRSSPR